MTTLTTKLTTTVLLCIALCNNGAFSFSPSPSPSQQTRPRTLAAATTSTITAEQRQRQTQRQATTTKNLEEAFGADQSTAFARGELLKLSNDLREQYGVILVDSGARDSLREAVEKLESLAEPPTDPSAMAGDWTLLCSAGSSTSTEKIKIDTSKIPFFNEGPFGDIKKTLNDSIEVIQRIKFGESSNSIDTVDHVIDYKPPGQLSSFLKNIPDAIKDLDINPLKVSDTKVVLKHKAEVEGTIPMIKTKLILQAVVVNVAGGSKNLEPNGEDVLGVNIPFGEFLNAGSFDTTFLDDSLRVSRSKTGPLNQIRVFVKNEAMDDDVEIVAAAEIRNDNLGDDKIVDDDDDDELADGNGDGTVDAAVVVDDDEKEKESASDDSDDDDDEIVVEASPLQQTRIRTVATEQTQATTNLDALLQQYGTVVQSLGSVAESVGKGIDDVDAAGGSELTRLRFAVAFENESEASEAYREALASRRGNNKSIVDAARDAFEKATIGGGWDNEVVRNAAPHSKAINKYITSENIVTLSASPEEDLVYVIRASGINDRAMMDEVSVNQLSEFFLYVKEIHSLVANQRSIRAGKLIEVVFANDITGVRKPPDTRFSEALSSSSEQYEKLYPTLAGPTMIMNLPFILQAFVALFKPLFPKTVQERLKFVRAPVLAALTDLTPLTKNDSTQRKSFMAETTKLLAE